MKIMAVDYGDARTGLAVCDRTETLASPIGVIHERDFAATAQKVSFAVREYDVKMVEKHERHSWRTGGKM